MLAATALIMGGTGHPLNYPQDNQQFITDYVNGANANWIRFPAWRLTARGPIRRPPGRVQYMCILHCCDSYVSKSAKLIDAQVENRSLRHRPCRGCRALLCAVRSGRQMAASSGGTLVISMWQGSLWNRIPVAFTDVKRTHLGWE